MIEKVSIKNYKCLQDVQIDLERFTVFVGPNASGKTSILEAIDLLCEACRSWPNVSDINLNEKANRKFIGPIEIAGLEQRFWYTFKMEQGKGRPKNQILSGQSLSTLSPISSKEHLPLPKSVLLRLETSKLIDPKANHDPTRMMPNGEGMHSALANITHYDPDRWSMIQEDLRSIIPSIKRVRHTPFVNHQPLALLFDTTTGREIPASQVSEGTLLVLGLLTAIHSLEKPDLILLDDIDRGLHPKAQKELVSLIRKLLETRPELQVFATTHSPYLLDCMRPEEVHMTYLSDDGGTICAPLTTHPKFAQWKDEFHPGEMWSMFGEQWLAKETIAP